MHEITIITLYCAFYRCMIIVNQTLRFFLSSKPDRVFRHGRASLGQRHDRASQSCVAICSIPYTDLGKIQLFLIIYA